LDTSHNPCFIGLSVLSTLDSLNGVVSKLSPDAAAVCQCFYNNYMQGKSLEITLSELEDAFTRLIISNLNSKERLAKSLNYLSEKRIVEEVPEKGSVKMIDFYLFVI
jgi:hypothetical protein